MTAIIFWGSILLIFSGALIGLAFPARWGTRVMALSAFLLAASYAFVLPLFTRAFIDLNIPQGPLQKVIWPPMNWFWAIVCLAIALVSVIKDESPRPKWFIPLCSLMILVLQVLWFFSINIRLDGMSSLVQ